MNYRFCLVILCVIFCSSSVSAQNIEQFFIVYDAENHLDLLVQVCQERERLWHLLDSDGTHLYVLDNVRFTDNLVTAVNQENKNEKINVQILPCFQSPFVYRGSSVSAKKIEQVLAVYGEDQHLNLLVQVCQVDGDRFWHLFDSDGEHLYIFDDISSTGNTVTGVNQENEQEQITVQILSYLQPESFAWRSTLRP